MSLLGKILAVVNVLAAIGFIYLAASDYGKRQHWSYAVFRHDLAINGLPLDDNEKDVDGRARVKDLSQSTLAETFQGLGSPVSTQLAELQRVQNDVNAKISGDALTVPNPLNNQPLALGTPEQKRAWFLLPLARSLTDRDLRLTQLFQADPNLTEEAFSKALPDVQARRQDISDAKQTLANLLFAWLEPGEGDLFESQAYKRFVAVVGRKGAAAAVDNQAAALAQLARETDDLLAAGRSNFAAAHGRLVTRVRDVVEVVDREKATLESQRNLTARQQDLVAERDRQVKTLEANLETGRKTTRAFLAEQLKMQEALLNAERKLRDANSQNQKLEREIRSLEK
jgi:hypothetical protein